MGILVKSYKELDIWKNGIKIVEIVYQIISVFPDSEKFVLSNQLTKSAISIPSKNAEGFGRGSKKEFARFIGIAIGSLFELETQILIANKLNYIKDDDFESISKLLESQSKMLYSFKKKMLESTNN